MRNGQHQHHKQRMRGRGGNNNNRRSHNPLTRVYESNGPDVKIRGTANHIAEKYLQLARDAQSSGDPISAENYFQHAEHYFRLIAAAQEQFRQNNPNFQQPRPDGAEHQQFAPQRTDEGFEYGEEDAQQPPFAAEAPFGTREPQPYLPRDAQPFTPREGQPYQREGQPHENRPQGQPRAAETSNVESLPAFITGGAPQPQQGHGSNGYDGQGGGGDRFPLHRRRRRHRGPRGDANAPQHGGAGEQSDDGPGNG